MNDAALTATKTASAPMMARRGRRSPRGGEPRHRGGDGQVQTQHEVGLELEHLPELTDRELTAFDRGRAHRVSSHADELAALERGLLPGEAERDDPADEGRHGEHQGHGPRAADGSPVGACLRAERLDALPQRVSPILAHPRAAALTGIVAEVDGLAAALQETFSSTMTRGVDDG
ncbi:MAG: hypothetical protein IT376_11355 [Polyangiaceae bacterium]|nr:hypothetical protein [Polyangiaceae bacterium]